MFKFLMREILPAFLSQSHHSRIIGFKCLEDAWLQIVECRCMLKWIHVYGHYLPLLHEHDEYGHLKRKETIFEILQGLAEQELKGFL